MDKEFIFKANKDNKDSNLGDKDEIDITLLDYITFNIYKDTCSLVYFFLNNTKYKGDIYIPK